MKQTNNAIKFLLAQYRAIFKHAYLKGLASAVIMTAGLAAGATVNAEDKPLDLTALKGVDAETQTIQVTTNEGADGTSEFNDVNVGVSGTKNVSGTFTVNITGFSGSSKQIIASGEGVNILNATNVNWNIASSGTGISIKDMAKGSLELNTGAIKVSAATNAATLTVESVSTGLGTTVNLNSLVVGEESNSGSVTIKGAGTGAVATLKANEITLGTSGSVALEGATATDAIFAGKLTTGSVGTIKVADQKFGTISTYTAENDQTAVTLDLLGTSVIDLSNTDTNTLKLSSEGKLNVGTSLTIASDSTLDVSAITKADNTSGSNGNKLTVEKDAELKIDAAILSDILSGGGTGSGSITVNGQVTLNPDNDISALAQGGISGTGTVYAESLTNENGGSDTTFTGVTLTTPKFTLASGSLGTAEPVVTQTLVVSTADPLSGTITLSAAQGTSGSISGTETLLLDNTSTLNVSGSWDSSASIKLATDSGEAKLSLSGKNNFLTFSTAEKSLTVGKSGALTVSDEATLTFDKGASLTVSGTGQQSTVSVDGGQVVFNEGSKLNIASGDFIVTDSTVNLTQAEISGSSSSTANNIIQAGAEGTVIVDSLASNITFKAVEGGTIQANSYNGTGSNLSTAVSTDANSTFAVDNVTFTDETSATVSSIDGTLQINDSLSANGTVTFENSVTNLQFGDESLPTTKGTINQDLSLAAQNTNVFGSWTLSQDKTLSVTDGALNVGNSTVSGSLTVDKISDKSGAGSITVNSGSILTVNGSTPVTTPTTEQIGKDDYYGFALTDTEIKVSGGTFVIGKTAADKLMNADWEAGSEEDGKTDLAYDNFGSYSLSNNGTLQIDFDSDTHLTMDQFKQLKIELLGADKNGSISGGTIKLGSADITGVTDENGIIQTDKNATSGDDKYIEYTDYQNYKDVLTNAQLEAVLPTQLRNVNTSTEALTGANVGSIQLAQGETEVTLADNSSLNNAVNGFLISDSTGKKEAGAALQDGASLSLNDDGKVAEITLTAGSDEDNVTTLNANKNNTLASVVAEDGNQQIAVNTAFVVGAESKTTVTGEVKVETLTNNNSLTVGGDVATTTFNNSGSFISDSGTVTTETFADVAGSTTKAKSLTINDKSTVAGTVTVTDFSLTSKTPISGKTEIDNSQVTGTVEASGKAELSYAGVASGASVTAKTAVLDKDVDVAAGGKLISKETTIGVVEDGTYNVTADISIAGYANLGKVSFTSAGTGTIKSSLNVLGGEVVAESITGTKGAIIAVGADATDGTSGSTGALEITKTLDLNGATLKVDPEYDQNTALVAVKYLTAGSSGQNKDDVGIFDGNVFVGQNSALGIGINAATLQSIIAQYQQDGHFLDPNEDGNESAYGAMLYLEKPVSINQAYGITLTAGTAADLTTELGSVAIGNGGVMADVDGVDTITKANTIYFGANTALAVNTNNAKADSAYISFIDDDGNKAKNSTLVANGGEIVLYGDSYKKTYKLFDSDILIKKLDNTTTGEIAVVSANGFLKGTLDNSSSGSVSLSIDKDNMGVMMAGTSTPVQQSIIAYVNGYNGEYETEAAAIEAGAQLGTYNETSKLYEYNNAFLSQTVLGGNGSDVEKVARLGVYGGVAQAALTAGASTYEAVNSRMGVGAQTGSITFADNGQGAGLWITPVYKNHDSDGFEAQGVSYGADLDLYGVALGADYTLANGLRLGAAFNVGSGDADGQGAGAGVSNDFDYYGFTVYGGYTLDKLSVVADISYTAIDNDVEANTGVEKVTASMDSSNLSFGVTGQYAFDMNGVSVTPHAGLRYTYLDMDDYTVKGSEDIAKYAADSASVFSIPVGVTFAKEITTGAWTIKPALDLTLTANMGDDSVDGSVTWAGVENLQTNLESEVIDNFTYGATLGVSAKSGNMSFGFGVNYTGASSADEYGVSANARFVF